MFDSFGSKVKIKDSPSTQEKGLVGKIGKVYGQTTPSMMDFEIIGTPKDHIAVNVYFDDLKTSYCSVVGLPVSGRPTTFSVFVEDWA